MSNERAPWLEPPIQVIIQNPIQKKVDPEGAATNRISYLNESRTPTINIYTDASFQDNRTTAWAYFIKEKDEEIRGRLRNHTLITLAELHAVKATLIWRQTIHERVIIHSDSVGTLTITRPRSITLKCNILLLLLLLSIAITLTVTLDIECNILLLHFCLCNYYYY